MYIVDCKTIHHTEVTTAHKERMHARIEACSIPEHWINKYLV